MLEATIHSNPESVHTAGIHTSAETAGLDTLILQSRLTRSARRLLEAMGVRIEPVRWDRIAGPAVYRLACAQRRPVLHWLPPEASEMLMEDLRREEDDPRTPEWAHDLLRRQRAGTLLDMDDGIEFGDDGIDAGLVLHDLLRHPGA
ncbi:MULTISPECIES: hypothetical protein [Gammaproteobacteria]|uniref:Uncharacterized protein n=1 Tax=Vreelandella halophila TaxID=86177 RepID=A0A9X4YC78_9GAMM|nr:MULTISPECIES: hypothetical protein [Gammaproteobacteria]KAA8980785.1 hypothetical protein F3089_11275 [Halospina sp. K52047b]MYL26553.1 hypothetical protein [Halomonas utahensis]MYL73890.1 hypothetical protein [Halomonas sp. 22501_18_FS]